MEIEIRKKDRNYRIIMINIIFFIILAYYALIINNLYIYFLMCITIFSGIYHIFVYKNEKIVFSNDGIKYTNIFNREYINLWENISYIKQKKQYFKSTGRTTFSTRYEIIVEYIFKLENGNKICLNEKDFLPAAKNIFESALRKNKIKEEKCIVDGEEVKVLRTLPVSFLMNLLVSLILSFLCTAFVSGLIVSFQMEILLVGCIFLFFDFYFIRSVLIEVEQLIQKVYFIENRGFYKVILGNKKFYEFKDIDKCIMKRYRAIQSIENKATLYKDNKKVLQITNSNKGFYEFIDEIRYKEIDKK